MHRTQLSPLEQRLSFLTSVLLGSYCFDVHLGTMSMFFPICFLGFRAIHEIPLEYYQALIDSKVMRNNTFVCLHEGWWRKKPLIKLWLKGLRTPGAPVVHLNKSGLEFSKSHLSEAVCMIFLSTYPLYQY